MKALMTGFVGINGSDMYIRAGVDYPADHPVVVAHPDKFEAPEPEPEPARRGRVSRG
jgi:hypothetical protein